MSTFVRQSRDEWAVDRRQGRGIDEDSGLQAGGGGQLQRTPGICTPRQDA